MNESNKANGNHPGGSALRLLIVDDQPLIRRGLAMMLASEPGIEVVGQAADGEEAVQMVRASVPDVVVMDLQMPRKSGVVATRQIRAEWSQTRVVVLTTYDDDELVYEALRAGAQAYLLKDASEVDVLETIRAVHRGESRLSPTIARKVIDQFRTFAAQAHPGSSGGGERSAAMDPAPVSQPLAITKPQTPVARHEFEDPLTDKEQRVLELISQGKNNRQIADAVFLAEGTVKNYVSRIMDKLHAHSRIELAVRGVHRRG